jgi:hypothetical protein
VRDVPPPARTIFTTRTLRRPGGQITHNDAYLDSGDVARQLGFLPATGSSAEAKLLEDDGGVTVFDAGIEDMTRSGKRPASTRSIGRPARSDRRRFRIPRSMPTPSR